MDTPSQPTSDVPPAHAETAQKNTLMAALAYVGPLIIIPFLAAKDEPFVRFHIRQGLLILIGVIAVWFLMSTFWFLFPLWQLINLGILILAIIGIVNVVQGKEKELPLIGKYAQAFKI